MRLMIVNHRNKCIEMPFSSKEAFLATAKEAIKNWLPAYNIHKNKKTEAQTIADKVRRLASNPNVKDEKILPFIEQYENMEVELNTLYENRLKHELIVSDIDTSKSVSVASFYTLDGMALPKIFDLDSLEDLQDFADKIAAESL